MSITLLTRCGFVMGLVASCLTLENSANAQPLRGGEYRFPASATVDELVNQSDLWILDVYFKPMRILPVEVTDPKTGEKKLEHVWYITYRAFNHQLEVKGKENIPVNELDKPIAPPQFVPEALLVVTDNDRKQVYYDQIFPEALAAINKREKANYKSAVNVVGAIPTATEPNSPDDVAIEGVFMWRGIDPDANRYTVYLTGFSNAIRVVENDDKEKEPVEQNKTIMQKYWRRGDRYDQKESEIVLDGDVQWIYR